MQEHLEAKKLFLGEEGEKILEHIKLTTLKPSHEERQREEDAQKLKEMVLTGTEEDLKRVEEGMKEGKFSHLFN